MTGPITADMIRTWIAKRHLPASSTHSDTVVFFELRDGTGLHSNGQQVDAFVLHTWPSKKFFRFVYEIKVSRSDFLRELSHPEKRAWGMEISNEFWFACPPKVVEPSELPEGCGLMLATAGGLKVIKAAPQRVARELRMAEVAAIARASSKSTFLDTVRWKHAGKEITEAALKELIQSERSRVEADEIAGMIIHRVQETLVEWETARTQYVKALTDAGCPIPPFLNSPFSFNGSWLVDNWLRQVRMSTPDAAAALTARTELRNVEGAVARLRAALGG